MFLPRIRIGRERKRSQPNRAHADALSLRASALSTAPRYDPRRISDPLKLIWIRHTFFRRQ